ncbi:MAG TPA: RimK family protein [Wenzhouxiangellaceae bacterium]|nr:RimK family protein [Wenzhouxiangellaceae bacterium]
MRHLVVVDSPAALPDALPDVEIVAARDYLADPRFSGLRGARVYNLCASYRYQATGYYVSLLAAARGHRPLPSVATMLDLKSPHVVRLLSGELQRQIGRSLKPIRADHFVLSIYFGRNLAERHETLSRALFKLFPAPLLRAEFTRADDDWMLKRLAPIGFADVPESHREFMHASARRYFAGERPRAVQAKKTRFDLAMLVNPAETHPPSDEQALKRFERAGAELGFYVERIGPDDIGRLAEFDALFIRETTAVNHHTFRFARKAAAEGLVVIDDPDSILKCTNKVYLAELLARHNVPAPKTMLVHRDNIDEIENRLGLPVVLKQPDSAFSVGVVKVLDAAELKPTVKRLLKASELVVAQEYLPTTFDWRVGVLDGRPLYVCRYHMARGHWQIIKHDGDAGMDEGNVDTLAIGEAPDAVIRTAVKAAGLIGNGLYGVDLKESDGKVMVIEVNDNPSIDAGIEDDVLKGALYREIMGVILKRVESSKQGEGGGR